VSAPGSIGAADRGSRQQARCEWPVKPSLWHPGDVLHHVSLEVPPEQIERSVEFWGLLGFAQVEPPESIAEFVTWFERGTTQIHLIQSTDATVPRAGHAAVVAEDFQGIVDRLTAAGFEVEQTRELWGERRAFATAPGGHLVELMAAPPAPAARS
jgi:catechol 2,3-dioxygenase-like lactoylglutathione lyase family enzyme